MPDPLALLADRLDPAPVDVFALLGYEPTPRQSVFHAAVEEDVFYGGAAGGGKTRALLMEGIRACVRYPGIRVGAFRRTYDELAESFFKELAAIDFASALGARWNGTQRELRFRAGSIIRFRYLESVKHATRRQGGEYQLILFDERTLIPPAAVDILVNERTRSGRADIPVLGIRSAANPGGVGHGAVKSRFIEPTGYGAHTYVDDHGRTVRFVPAKVTDNPHVDAGYLAHLDAIADPVRRAAMRDGDWDSFSGQFFSEWSRERHVVVPFAIPSEWSRTCGVDFGYATPWAVVWTALDPDGRAWVYREIYEAGVGERDQARRILRAEGALTEQSQRTDGGLRRRRPDEKVRARLADPAMWAKVGDATPIAITYAAEGCGLVKADNDRLNGWQRVHTYLAEGPACAVHREMGWDTCPMLHVFDGLELIEAVANAPRDEDHVEDLDSDYDHDHDLDALRYDLMHLPVPRVGREAKAVPVTPDERFFDFVAKRAQVMRRAARRS